MAFSGFDTALRHIKFVSQFVLDYKEFAKQMERSNWISRYDFALKFDVLSEEDCSNFFRRHRDMAEQEESYWPQPLQDKLHSDTMVTAPPDVYTGSLPWERSSICQAHMSTLVDIMGEPGVILWGMEASHQRSLCISLPLW